MALENLSRRGGQRGGRGGGSHNIFGVCTGYELQKPQKGVKMDPALDFMRVTLMRDAGQLKAETNEQGELITSICVSLKPAEAGGTYVPMSIRNMEEGRPPAQPLGENGIVSFKDVEPIPGRPGYFVARRVEAAVRKFDANLHFPYSGMVSVRKEIDDRVKKPDSLPYQNRVVSMTDYAQVFTDEQDLKKKVAESFVTAKIHGASPQVIVRAIEMNEAGAFEYALSRELSLWDKDARAEITPEQAVERFISGADGKDGPDILGQFSDPNVILEVIPQFMYRTGKASLPSSKMLDNNNQPRVIAPKDMWRYDDNVACRVLNEKGRIEAAYTLADIVMSRRVNKDPETMDVHEYSRTHSTFFQEQGRYQGRFRQEELVTPNLPETLVESLKARASEAAKAAIAADKANVTPEAEQEPEAEQSSAPGMA